MKQTHISAKSGEQKTSGKSVSQAARNQPPIQCPECTSQRVWRDGLRRTGHGDVQRYICRECGRRFSEASKPLQMVPYGSLNRTYAISLDRRVCVSEREAKNLAKVETRQKRAAGATKLTEADIKGKIIEYLWHLKKQGYAKSTVKVWTQKLKQLVKEGANLLDPESVKHVLAAHENWSDTYKSFIVCACQNFAKMLGLRWDPPRYIPTKELPFIPLEKEIDALIAGCGKKVATSLQLIKETGMRIGETWQLRWIDIDEERQTIRVRPEKHGNPRLFKVSGKLIAMLNTLPKTGDRVFGGKSLNAHRWNFLMRRKRLAQKLQNPRLKNHVPYTSSLEGHNGIPPDKGHPIRKTAARTQSHKLNPNLHPTREL